MAFNPREYWEHRLTESWSLAGVGYGGLGEGFNRWAYRIRRDIFLNVVKHALTVDHPRVVDIGSGTGFYVDLWQRMGASYILGSDITEAAVQKLRLRFPTINFVRMDVSDANFALPLGQFDAASLMDVLFHIVDQAKYELALRNVASVLKPGGFLICSDSTLSGETVTKSHIVFRSQGCVGAAMRRAGFAQVLCRPLFILMNEPVDSKSRLHHAIWNRILRAGRQNENLANLIGATLYPFESLLVKAWRSYRPSTKLFLYRKVV